MGNLITEDQFLKVLPKKMKGSINSSIINNINKAIQDPILMDAYRDNILSYTSVMIDGKFKIDSYLDAVKYVSFKLFGSSNIEAYIKTFPDRYQRFIDTGASPKDISAYVSGYNKTKLVNLIFEQTIIPTHILNADLYQKALNVQAELMLTANSEKVRTDAANSLLTHLKMPETNKIELDITVKEDSAIADLRASTLKLVDAQQRAISSGTMNARQIAHSKLEIVNPDEDVIIVVDAEVIEIIPEDEQESFMENLGGFSGA